MKTRRGKYKNIRELLRMSSGRKQFRFLRKSKLWCLPHAIHIKRNFIKIKNSNMKNRSILWLHLGCYILNLEVAAAAAKSLQSCPPLCDPIDGSPPGFPVPGILQARTLDWVAISFSNAWKWKVKSLSRVQLFTTPWTAAYQVPPSMGFSRQEYWSGLPLPSPNLKVERVINRTHIYMCITHMPHHAEMAY